MPSATADQRQQMLNKIKQLREETGVGIMDARKALTETGGDLKKAKAWLNQNAVMKAAKKADRVTEDGSIFAYVHQTGKVAVLVKLACETDFVARTDDFRSLGKEIAMQVASMDPTNVKELLDQPWIRDGSKIVDQLIKEHIAKLGENIQILEFARMIL